MWHMLITARSIQGSPDDRGVIGHATSPDLRAWTVQPPLSSPGAGFVHLEVIPTAVVDGRAVGLFSCLGTELAEPGRPGDGGVWAFPISSATGPFDTASAYRLTDERFYVGRIVQDRAGQAQFLAFRNVDPETGWQGEIADPVPVHFEDDRLVVASATTAEVSAAWSRE
jgi:beta-fructofuranosidase